MSVSDFLTRFGQAFSIPPYTIPYPLGNEFGSPWLLSHTFQTYHRLLHRWRNICANPFSSMFPAGFDHRTGSRLTKFT